jgi:hypothetical protein
MNQKSFEELRPKFESMMTDELKTIWKENDQDEYTLRELETVRQLLHVRNAEIPKQDEFEESEDGVYSQDVVNSLLKGAMFFLLAFGVVNLVYWYFGDYAERQILLKKFTEVKPVLWIHIYGQVVICGVLIFMSFLCFLQKNNIKILVFSGMLLIFSGLWNLFSNFLLYQLLRSTTYIKTCLMFLMK